MKRIVVSLLCLAIVFAMTLTFVACDEAAGTLPGGDGNAVTGGTTGGDTTGGMVDGGKSDGGETTKTYTEEDAKLAFTGMTEQLGKQETYSVDVTITLKVPMKGINIEVPIPVKVEADATAKIYHARIVIPGALTKDTVNSTVEIFLTPEGTYLGSDADVTDDRGNMVMSYLFFPQVTSDIITEIVAWIDQDEGTDPADTGLGDINLDDINFDDITGSIDLDDITGSVGLDDLLGFTNKLPKVKLKLEAGENGGYRLTASADAKELVNAMISTVIGWLQYSPKDVAALIFTSERLATYGEMTVEEMLASLDALLGEDTVDRILEQLLPYIAGNTEEPVTYDAVPTDGEGETDASAVSEARQAVMDMFGDMSLLEIILASQRVELSDNLTDADKEKMYEYIADMILAEFDEEKIGDLLTVGEETTLNEFLQNAVFTECNASVTFTLTETYLPTAVTAEAKLGWQKPQSSGSVTASASMAYTYGQTVTLPDDMLLLPADEEAYEDLSGDQIRIVLTCETNGFTVASAKATIGGETIDLRVSVDAETGAIILSGIELNDDTSVGYLEVEVTMTKTVGDRTYTYKLTPMIETAD